MKATLDCLECIASQALRAARVATNNPDIQRRILNETIKRIPDMDASRSPAELSLAAYEITATETGIHDPYKDLKKSQNEIALAIEPELREMVANSDDRLATALHLAAAGNVIDLGVQHASNIDIHAEIRRTMSERFAVDHTDAFRDSLSKCRDLLFLLDNAGEIVFDKILIEELQRHTPVTAVVKAGPIINDVLMEDAVQVGLTKVCEVIDNGGAFVGSPLNLVPQTFLDRMANADVIVGKGQGNYETIDVFPGDVFLILKAKCQIIAQHMGVQYGQVALISTRLRNTQASAPQQR